MVQIRSVLKRRDGLVIPLMAAPFTMSVMFMALLVVGRFSNKYVELSSVVLGNGFVENPVAPNFAFPALKRR